MSFHPREFKRCTPGINKRKKELPAFVTVGMGLGLNRYETKDFATNHVNECGVSPCFTWNLNILFHPWFILNTFKPP